MENKSDYDKFNTFIIVWIVVFSLLFIGFALYFAFNKGGSKKQVQENPIVSEEKVNFGLKGEEKITLKLNEIYVEPGYYAISDTKGDVSGHVSVEGEVDTSVAGTYELTYILKYNGNIQEEYRTVKVLAEGEEEDTDGDETDDEEDNAGENDNNDGNNGGNSNVDPDSSVTIHLNGYKTVYVFKGGQYQDAGARAVNKNNVNVSDRITTSGSVNTSEPGNYTITYSITDSQGRKVSVSRTVKVVEMNAKIEPTVAHYTKDDIKLNIAVSAHEFSHIILPNGQKVTTNTYSYPVSENGQYSFQVYNAAGLGKKYTYTVKNIDKQSPTGSCQISHNSTGSVLTIDAKDNIGISVYVYKGNKYNTNRLTFSRHLPANKAIQVGFYDKAGNYGTATCTVPGY